MKQRAQSTRRQLWFRANEILCVRKYTVVQPLRTAEYARTLCAPVGKSAAFLLDLCALLHAHDDPRAQDSANAHPAQVPVRMDNFLRGGAAALAELDDRVAVV